MTVYSYEKILEINEIAKELDMVQPLLIRVNDTDSALYSGQVGGFLISELEELLNKIEALSNVKVGGLTVFPALLFDGKKNEIVPTDNYKVLQRAMAITEKLGYHGRKNRCPSVFKGEKPSALLLLKCHGL